MTDEQPIDTAPQQPATDPKTDGLGTTSLTEPSQEAPVTAPVTTIALPERTKLDFWQKADIDLHEAIAWLKAELEKI